MSYLKIRRYWIHISPGRAVKILLFLMILILCAGCGQKTAEEITEDDRERQISEESIELAEDYKEIYHRAAEQGTLDSLEVQQSIIDAIGEFGYAAADRDHQRDMVNPEQVERFCKNAQDDKKDEVSIFSVLDDGGFVRYDMITEQGEVNVTVTTLSWKEETPEIIYHHEFTAHSWKYTEKGYFFVEEYQPPGYDGAPGQLAFRVKPLPEKLRELNRKYVLPVGYEGNNLMITDWEEGDFSEIDFYDLYEHFYYQTYGKMVPYERGPEAEYQVPAEDFEEVILPHFRMTPQQIRENTVFDAASQSYRYRPRWLNDATLPYGPYPEVLSYEEQGDGTLCLWIEGVWERKLTDRAVRNKLTVRPLEDGSCQYVSNEVEFMDDKLDVSWYTPRLAEAE